MSHEIPPGREKVVALRDAALWYRMTEDQLLRRLGQEEWVRVGPRTYASLASSGSVRLRFYDELDVRGRPVPVRGAL